MISGGSNPSTSQRFRAESTFHNEDTTITIPTLPDGVSEQRIIRWEDVVQYFPNATGIMNGEDAVLFMIDSNTLESYKPLRILHHPGVVLKVIGKDNDRGNDRSTPTAARAPSSGNLRSLRNSHSSSAIGSDASSTTSDVPPWENLDDEVDSQALVSHTRGPSAETQVSRHASQRYSTISQAMMTPRRRPSSQQLLNGSLDRLQLDMDGSSLALIELQQQMKDMQQLQEQMMDQIVHIQHAQQQFQVQHQEQQQQQQQQQRQMEEMQHLQDETRSQIQEIHDIQHQTPQSRQQFTQLHEVDSDSREHAHQHSPATPQLQKQALDHLMVINYRVQELLTRIPYDTTVPRLFVVLPYAKGQYRLYFLCECSAHVSEACEKRREVHAAKHPGYGLLNTDDFFANYGVYVLAMMYAVKYGAITPSLAIPPLAQFKRTETLNGTEGRRHFIKRDIEQLVDDMITYLEDSRSINFNDMDVTSHQQLDSTRLAQLNQYLDVKEGEDTSGGLYRTITREGHCTWICDDHLGEKYDSAMSQLKELLTANGGIISEGSNRIEIELKGASKVLEARLYDAMAKVCEIRGDRQPLTVLDIHLGYIRSITWPRANLILDLHNVESLTIKFSRLSIMVSVHQGQAQDRTVIVESLQDLTSHDIQFIRQCCTTELVIKKTPKEENEPMLLNMLQDSVQLRHLRIGCVGERSFAIINLVVTARSEIRQRNGQLRSLEVMDEDLIPFDVKRPYDHHDHIAASLSFSEDTDKIDMHSHVMLQTDRLVNEDALACKFFRHFGWSIETLDVPWTFSDHLAGIWDQATTTRDSQLQHLGIVPSSLTLEGLEAVGRVIDRSYSLKQLGLYFNSLHEKDQLSKAEYLLARYRWKMTTLTLFGNYMEKWLPTIATACSSREDCPRLTTLELSCYRRSSISRGKMKWVADMVSAPPQPPAGSVKEAWSRLRSFHLSCLDLDRDDWDSVLRSLDFTALENLELKFTNAPLHQQLLPLLINQRVRLTTPAPLSYLDLTGTHQHDIVAATSYEELQANASWLQIKLV